MSLHVKCTSRKKVEKRAPSRKKSPQAKTHEQQRPQTTNGLDMASAILYQLEEREKGARVEGREKVL